MNSRNARKDIRPKSTSEPIRPTASVKPKMPHMIHHALMRATVDNLVARIKAWWIMCGIFGLTLAVGRIGSLVLFGLMSFLALREFITLTRTHRADHRTLFWAFFVF